MASWNSTSAKSQLRTTALRLGQLQERKDSQGQITRRDISTLLQQGNVGLARAKAQNLIQEDAMGDLMEVLEMHIGVLIERFSELEQQSSPSPVIVEAASSIIYAAPHTEVKEVAIVRDLLVHYLGPDFARSAVGNRDNYVSSRVIRALAAPPISAAKLNEYIAGIASAYGVKWIPELGPQEVLNALSEVLDPTVAPVVDLPRLQKLCSHGIPDNPSWLRPRIWKIFFGILPLLKSSWQADIQKQRDSYYDLIRRLLEPISSLSEPTVPLVKTDSTILEVSNQLSRVPHSLFIGLEEEPEHNALCPLDESAPDGLRIPCAGNLTKRLQAIRDTGKKESSANGPPEIRLEADNGPPAISLSEPESFSSRRPNAPTTLLYPRALHGSDAHPRHFAILHRLLYVHTCLNPAHHLPHIPSLLVPLYGVLLQEIEVVDLAHAEADTFWLFEAIVGEFSDLEDEEGSNVWRKKLGERLAWADVELAENLKAKGLDPALPHYSYRWLAPLLTHTLPLPSVYMIWDALFCCPMRDRHHNPKLEHLLDVCASLLIRARGPLYRLGKPGRRSPGLWGDESASVPPPSPLRAWEFGDAFLEGMSLLQLYPVEAAGGIERILQTASDLSQRRREEEARALKNENLGLGARLKVTMWKGFTNQVSGDSPDSSPEEDDHDSDHEPSADDGNETERPQVDGAPGLTTRFANSVWRGITNQSSMEVPASPLTPLSPAVSHPPSPTLPPLPLKSPAPIAVPTTPLPQSPPEATSKAVASMWGYAEKLKDSDTAATLAKASSNWRAKAMSAWTARASGHGSRPSSDIGSPSSPASHAYSPVGSTGSRPFSSGSEGRRGSLIGHEKSGYSPPPRPAFFRQPRDSMMPGSVQIAPSSPSPTSPDMSPHSEKGFLQKAHNIQSSLAALTGLQPPEVAPAPATPKSGPRPLLLGSQSTIRKSPNAPPLRTGLHTPQTQSHQRQWSEVMRAKTDSMKRGSQSSVSSLSPSDALGKSFLRGRTGSDWESDTGASRIVPLNRRSVSPMAPHFKIPGRPTSMSSSGYTSERGLLSPTMGERRGSSGSASSRGWGQVDVPDSPSPPTLKTPINVHAVDDTSVRISEEDTNGTPLEPPSPAKKLVRKKTPPLQPFEGDSDSSMSQSPSSKSPRARARRNQQRPANLKIRASPSATAIPDQKTPSPQSLAPVWPDDHDPASSTPRAAEFDSEERSSPVSPRRTRKASGDVREPTRKGSDSGTIRPRKISTSGRSARDSAAEEGDDEGYDEFLSAYESEDPSKPAALR